jgi:hypothetical protein
VAIGTLAAIGLGAAGIGSVLSSKSNKKAAKTAAAAQQNVANSNNALAQNIYNQNAATLAPYVQSGIQPNALLAGAMGYGNEPQYRNAFKSFIENSDYGFKFGEGANTVNSGYAGNGTLQSGAAMRDLERFRQDLQSGYRGEFNSLLANQQAVGLGGASALAGVGQNYVNTVSANNQNAGDALANSALIRGQNNPLANAIGLLGGGLFGMAR